MRRFAALWFMSAIVGCTSAPPRSTPAADEAAPAPAAPPSEPTAPREPVEAPVAPPPAAPPPAAATTPSLTPAAPASGRAADTRVEILANGSFYRSSANDRPPWDQVEVTPVFGFLKQPRKGSPVTGLPVDVVGPPLALKITRTERRAESEPTWWEVDLEPVTAREYFDLAAPPDAAPAFLGRVAVLYPALPEAVLLDPASIDPKDLPERLAPRAIAFAVDSSGDRRPDGIEASFCCEDETKSATLDACEYTCSRTFLRRRGAWVQVYYSQPE
ncbi:MAG: hypothetical protein R3B09_24260 [Nannocystaceae bacterium]